ncbi:hypothetical protein GCM10007940_45030 [Portibacter lacus]|uniref:Right handed beta helix domain-containing protein n=2 Tax=Portibacter lacus TaxID=1099794 RepID=A0AA37WGH8_9BACT|nr:hypothetical protein GCM10007940_45030 [Portibacter lacus]
MILGVFISLLQSCGTTDILPDPTLEVTVSNDQMVDFGTEVTLNGFANHSAGESTEVLWEIVSKPNNSNLAITGSDQNSIRILPDELGEYVLRFTATSSDGLSKFDEVVITVIKSPVRLTGFITSDLVLENIYDDPNDPDYIVSEILFLGAQVTIEEGVLIIFEENAGIEIQTDGSMIAVGSESNPIVMTGVQQTVGFWKGLNFESRNPKNNLKFVTVEYGGSGGFDGADRKANITINDAIVEISNCSITHSEGLGLLTRNEEDELPGFKNNVLSNNAIPMQINKSQFHFLDASNDYSGNVDDYINSWGQNSLSENVTWNNLNVPYRFSPGFERIESDLTIEKGTEFIGQPNGGLLILTDGSIVAIGSESEPITFRGEQDVRGYWMGISIASNTNRNELAYVIVTNGGQKGFDGAGRKANIIIEDNSRLKMSNCTLSKSGEYGLIVRELKSILTNFENNTITDNIIPIECKMNHFQYFDNASDLTGNDKDEILTSWANFPTDIDVTWKKTTVPYKLSRPDYIGSKITIEPGVEIIGMDDAGIEVRSEGTIIAMGTPSEPIIFRGEENVQGYWRGIRIFSNKPQNRMEHIQLFNGGSRSFYGEDKKASLEVADNAMLQLHNSEISESDGYGVYVKKDGQLSESENTFVNNKYGSILYDD